MDIHVSLFVVLTFVSYIIYIILVKRCCKNMYSKIVSNLVNIGLVICLICIVIVVLLLYSNKTEGIETVVSTKSISKIMDSGEGYLECYCDDECIQYPDSYFDMNGYVIDTSTLHINGEYENSIILQKKSVRHVVKILFFNVYTHSSKFYVHVYVPADVFEEYNCEPKLVWER